MPTQSLQHASVVQVDTNKVTSLIFYNSAAVRFIYLHIYTQRAKIIEANTPEVLNLLIKNV